MAKVLKTEDYLDQFPNYKHFQNNDGQDIPEWWEMHPETVAMKDGGKVKHKVTLHKNIDIMRLSVLNRTK